MQIYTVHRKWCGAGAGRPPCEGEYNYLVKDGITYEQLTGWLTAAEYRRFKRTTIQEPWPG